MIQNIIKLINISSINNKELEEQRVRYLINELEKLSDEHLQIFENILKTNSIDVYKNLFSEKDFNTIKNFSKDKNIRENFSIMSYIIDSFYIN